MRMILSFLLFSPPLAAEDEWPRFRGPNGTGISTTVGLPMEFGPSKNVIWKTPLPPGHSSPVLTRDKVFVTAHTPEKQDYRLLVIALERSSGQILWQREAPRLQEGRLRNINGPASPSPVTDGKNVYVFFQEFGLLSFSGSGEERWRLPMGPFNMFYGFGASPILIDGKVILSVDQDEDSYLLAVDSRSGRQLWKTERPEVISGYSTPAVYTPAAGARQVIVPESFRLTAYALNDGKRVWWVNGLACEMKSAPSLDREYLYINGWGFPQNQQGRQIRTVSHEEALRRYDRNRDGLITRDEVAGGEAMDKMLKTAWAFETFDSDRTGSLDAREWEVFRSMMASENGLLAIRLGGQGDMTSSAMRWKYRRPVPQVSSTLLYGGALFMINDGGILISLDPATGEVVKQGRLKAAAARYFASPVGAEGKLWLVSQDGAVSVVAARGDWEILSVNTLGDEVFATPAIAAGRIYLRTRSTLYCFGNP